MSDIMIFGLLTQWSIDLDDLLIIVATFILDDLVTIKKTVKIIDEK